MPRNTIYDEFLPPRPPVAPWTATRCNRTLRQLNSFVARLEKWHKDFLAAQEESSLEEDGDKNRAIPEGEEPGAQVSWLSARSKRDGKARKNYASRMKLVPQTPAVKSRPPSQLMQKTPMTNAQLPSSILRTPVDTSTGVTSNSGHTARKPSLNIRGMEDRESKTETGGRTKQNSCLAQRREDIIRDGNTIITSFLVTTADPKLPTQWKGSRTDKAISDERGAKSLLSMCLDKVSKSMVEEQEHIDAKHDGYDGQCDIVGSELGLLEDYFGDSKTGWPPLRTVTRACGIHMVSRLIKSGAFPKAAASDLAIRSFGCPLLADFGETITSVLIEADANTYTLPCEWSDMPGLRAFSAYSFDKADVHRQAMYFRWLTQAIKQELDPIPLIVHFARFQVLVDALLSYIALGHTAAAAELIEITFSSALGGDCHTSHECLRYSLGEWTEATKNPCVELQIKPLSASFLNRLEMFVRVFLTFPTGSAGHLMARISSRAQELVDHHHDGDLPESQQLIIAQIFFISMCFCVIDGRDVGTPLQTSFELLLRGSNMKCIVAHLVSTLFCMNLDRASFIGIIRMVSGIECANCGRLQRLLGRVCAEAAMDYAAEQPEEDDSIRPWASGIEDKSRIGDKSSDEDAPTPLNKRKQERHTGYRWDGDVEEWIERTPARPLKVLTGAEKLQVRKAFTGPFATVKGAVSKSAIAQGSGHGFKRKSLCHDFELHRDDDFEYKKARRKPPVPASGWSESSADIDVATFVRLRRRRVYQDEDSQDELSLLE